MRIFVEMNWHEYFSYSAESGQLTWKSRPREHFKNDTAKKRWDTQFAGTVAGHKMLRTGVGSKKAVMVSVIGKNLCAHRIIWEMVYGEIPHGMEIDHINLDPWDNSLKNLRLATHMQNMANQRMRCNKTGFKGVRMQENGRYQSSIRIMGVQRALGTYDTALEAHEVYAKEAARIGGEFVRTQ